MLRVLPVKRRERGFTLIELLCAIAIIVLLAALLLPALRKGQNQAQRIGCVNNLRQTGLAFHDFAHQHQDQFPMQVSTNLGGSLEFLQAVYQVDGEFYFSYRHFQPLAGELDTPRVLVCPADTRWAATNFAALRNDNLSYFIAADPEFGRSDSILAGDRNIAPVYDSIAKVGGALYLKWTEELHKFKGNVLFADGHVSQMNGVLQLTNAPAAVAARLLVPTTRPPVLSAQPGSKAGGGTMLGSSWGGGRGNISIAYSPVSNELGQVRLVATNISVSPARRTTPIIYSSPSDGGSPGVVLPASTPVSKEETRATNVAGAKAALEDPAMDEKILQAAHRRVVVTGKQLAELGAQNAYKVPWVVVLLLLVLVLELIRRARARRRWPEPRKRSGVRTKYFHFLIW